MAYAAKVLAALIALVALLGMSNAPAHEPIDPNAVTIAVEIQCSMPIHALHCEYGINGSMLGGQGVTNARPGTPLRPGESVYFTILPEDYHNLDLEAGPFTFVLRAETTPGQYESMPGCTWQAHVGEVYRFVLTDAGETLSLSRMD